MSRFEERDPIFVQATEPVFGAHVGTALVMVHDPSRCRGDWCCIHNPSEHHMRAWPQVWRSDKRVMERTCPHGVGHPDPDDLTVRTTRWAGVHGCDRCCLAAEDRLARLEEGYVDGHA